MKKILKTALYVAVIGLVGFLLVKLGVIDATITKQSDGYPVIIQHSGDTVSVISTGQADSALISSGGRYCLIDAGQTSGGHITVTDYLDYAGVKEIELLVVTHFHYDHTSELIDVLNKYKVKNIVIPNLETKNVPTAQYFSTFLDIVERKNINLKPAAKGDRYTVGNGTLEILADTYNDLTENDTSVATLFTQGEFTFLSTGDGEAAYEQRLLKDFRSKVTLFAAGHHGSSTSNSKEFIKAVRPDFIAISAGKDNEYGHPHSEVTALFEKLEIPYRTTGQSGTIVYSIDNMEIMDNSL